MIKESVPVLLYQSTLATLIQVNAVRIEVTLAADDIHLR
jgi:hypothetical protein